MAFAHHIGSMVWIWIVKIAVIVLVVEVAVTLLSRHRAGDTSEKTNHRRGWMLVAVMTVTAVGLAWFL